MADMPAVDAWFGLIHLRTPEADMRIDVSCIARA